MKKEPALIYSFAAMALMAIIILATDYDTVAVLIPLLQGIATRQKVTPYVASS